MIWNYFYTVSSRNSRNWPSRSKFVFYWNGLHFRKNGSNRSDSLLGKKFKIYRQERGSAIEISRCAYNLLASVSLPDIHKPIHPVIFSHTISSVYLTSFFQTYNLFLFSLRSLFLSLGNYFFFSFRSCPSWFLYLYPLFFHILSLLSSLLKLF